MPMALGRRPTAKDALAFLCNPHTTRIHTKIIIVNTNFGGAVFRSTTLWRENMCICICDPTGTGGGQCGQALYGACLYMHTVGEHNKRALPNHYMHMIERKRRVRAAAPAYQNPSPAEVLQPVLQRRVKPLPSHENRTEGWDAGGRE